MSETKITDLVPQETIDKIKELNTEIQTLLNTYTTTAKELAKGVDVNVKVVGDIDKLEKLLVDKTKEATVATERLNAAISEQSQVVANTTNTISRQLMEQERVNKTQREAYTEHEKVKKLLDQYHDTYEEQAKSLVKINRELEQNKKAQKDNEKALSMGRVSMTQFTAKQAELIAQHRSLTQEKRTLTQIMTAEEKAAQSQEGSYVHMSQQLELLKKAYKDLSEEGRNSDFGKELEASIQNLDAHLKDVAADMGEFQRNVGNYAIAGQQGVVATESVIAAMNQEARTTQDLIDQTKILEEAKLMLNKEDANYQSTLDSLNAKIEENKRKLTDVSDILGREARSVSEAEAQNKRLSEAIKHIDLTSADAKKKLEEMRNQIERNNRTIAEATGANEKFADSVLGILGVNTNLGSSFQSLGQNGNFIDGLNTKTKAFAQTLMGLLANPWVLAFLGIAGIAAGFKWWYDYNKGMIEASRLTQNFTGLTGDAADKITTDTQAIADHMGKGFDDTIGAANTLVQQFGISWEEALTKIEDGIEAGADMNGRFVENINQFAPALRDAGVSVDEFVSILAETRNGIFDEKGVQDIIKGGTRLRAMTKQIAESLDACGISSKQMQEDLANGNITMLEAVQQVSAKLKELPENSQEAGQVMKNVFGETAAEGGTLLIQSLADVNTNLDEAKERMGDLGRLNREQMEAQKELNETLAAVFKMSGTSFEEMTIQAKTYIVQGLTNIIKGCVDIVNWFIRMYNNSLYVRGAVNSIVNSFKTLWEIAKFVLNQVMDSFKALGNMIEDVVTMNWDQVAGHWAEGMNALKGNVETMVRNIASNTADAFNNTLKDELKPVSIELDANLTGLGANPGNDKPKTPYSPTAKEPTDKEKAKAAKEAEKAAKEELKRIHELEESKIAVMAEGHEKELAMIRLKFKKKIDEIKGDGETENALRVQLAEQCQKEIADCELKYQTELAKINLENRLASVEEGSKEELDLKLAQLEATRAAELKAAERTGADVTLINDKFNKERLELEEEYANNLADKITERYGVEEITRNQEYSNAVNALKERYAKEMALAAGNAAKQEEIKRNLENDLYALEVEYSQKAGEAAIKMIEEILNLENLSAEDRLKWEQELAKAKIDLANQIADANSESVDRQIADDERLREKRKANLQNWLQVASDAIGNISELVNTLFDGQIEKLEEEQEANTEAGEKEQERITELVNKKVITQEEGEARKRAAEAQTAKKNEELEKKKQQLKHKQAVWEKANSLAQAGIATALAITHALPNLVLAAIAGAMGAIQIATILATPIPKYAKGTDYHRGGPAIVGDGGRSEVVLFNGGAWLTPDKPTLVNMPEGAVVIPSVMDYDDNPAGLLLMPVAPDKTPASGTYDDSAIRRGVSELIYLIKHQTRQQHIDSYLTTYELFKNKL
jgi:methyl-accepting chemotaxis protein